MNARVLELNYAAARRELFRRAAVFVGVVRPRRMTNPADRLSERLLVLRCQAGDDAAFEQLVVDLGPRLRYFLRKYCAMVRPPTTYSKTSGCRCIAGCPRSLDAGAFRALALSDRQRPRLSRVSQTLAANSTERRFGPRCPAGMR